MVGTGWLPWQWLLLPPLRQKTKQTKNNYHKIFLRWWNFWFNDKYLYDIKKVQLGRLKEHKENSACQWATCLYPCRTARWEKLSHHMAIELHDSEYHSNWYLIVVHLLLALKWFRLTYLSCPHALCQTSLKSIFSFGLLFSCQHSLKLSTDI